MMLMIPAMIAVGLMLGSCNARKKNTAAARQYTAFITRYNIYYNGDRHYSETLAEMEKKYEDDYSGMVYMHPAEARANEKAPQPTGDFNRSIEKAQKAIQLRSITKKPARRGGRTSDPKYKEWMKREEYNPFIHNAWLMMGRSQFMNGDFTGAAATFFYTSRHFSWLPKVVTEAQLWQARSYIAMDWLFEGETIINRIKKDQLTDNTLLGLYNYVYADLYIHSKEWEQALPYLQEAVRLAKGAQKTRLWFLLGQVYARLDKKSEAYQAYKHAGSASSASYRTKFNARIKQSEVYQGEDITPEVKALKRMTRYDRNKEYLDQIYYAIANLYLSRRDTAEAIANYRLAVDKSTRGGIDKAIAQITLGNLYFSGRRYELAQPCYAEAVPVLPADYPDITTLKRRSDVLDELAVYAQNVTLQDSLLKLSYLTKDEQLAVVNRLIEELKKKEKEEAEAARREAYEAERDAQGSQFSDNGAPKQFQINSDDSWYFYNQATRTAGKTEFQRRWGSRKLEDNWRRRNKSSFSLDEFGGDVSQRVGDEDNPEGPADTDVKESEANEKGDAKQADDPHFPEYYLKQIPSTDAERATANDVIQEGMYNIGLILKDKLDDPEAAVDEFDDLLKRYPDNIYRLDVYYNLYLIYMRRGDTTMAERYRQLILSDFAESKYGQALINPDYIENLKLMDQRQEALYEQAYEAYLDNDNKRVHAIYEQMSTDFPMTKLMPKFMFLHALAYATEGNSAEFNNVLKQMLERYPTTDVAPIASEWLKGLQKGRKLHAGAGGRNMRGMIWDISLGNDSTARTDGAPAFEIKEAEPQLLVFVYPTDVVSTNQLLFDIARHNFTSFVVRDFDLEPMNFGRLGMIVVKPFNSLDELNHYRRVMAASTTFKLPRGVRPVVISVKNFETLLNSGATLDDYFRFLDEQNYRDAQSDLLPYEAIEELPDTVPADASPESVEAPADSKAETAPVAEPDEPTEPKVQPKVAPSEPETVPDAPTVPETTPATQTVPETAPATPSVPETTPAPSVVPEDTPVAEPSIPAAKTEPAPYPVSTPKTTPGQTPVQSPTPGLEPTPAQKAEQTQKPTPTQKVEQTQKPTPTRSPATKSAPVQKPVSKPVLPTYEPGSEGDDPLLD